MQFRVCGLGLRVCEPVLVKGVLVDVVGDAFWSEGIRIGRSGKRIYGIGFRG